MNLLRKDDLYPFKIWLVLALMTVVIGAGTQAIAKPRRERSTVAEVGQSSTYGTNFTGTVKRYLLNPQGVVDGLLLDNGLEVRFAPHLTDSIVATVKMGDRITVTGNPGVPSNFGQEVQAYSITNTHTQRTVIDQPPADPPPPVSNVPPAKGALATPPALGIPPG